ncbi:MAG: hypothetical protein ACI9CV_002038, partial [Ilumatobacter sp.]
MVDFPLDVAEPTPTGGRLKRRAMAGGGRTSWITPSRLLGLLIGAFFAGPVGFVVWRTVRLGGDLASVAKEVPGPLWRTVQLSILVSVSAA